MKKKSKLNNIIFFVAMGAYFSRLKRCDLSNSIWTWNHSWNKFYRNYFEIKQKQRTVNKRTVIIQCLCNSTTCDFSRAYTRVFVLLTYSNEFTLLMYYWRFCYTYRVPVWSSNTLTTEDTMRTWVLFDGDKSFFS